MDACALGYIHPNTHIHNTHNIMAYFTDTLEPCHRLSDEGEMHLRMLLELKADEILFKHKHPIRYWLQRFVNLLRCGDSTWDGAHYSKEDKYKDGYSYVR